MILADNDADHIFATKDEERDADNVPAKDEQPSKDAANQDPAEAVQP